ncbi:class I SAM-dependent methyltransferase [Mycobacterium paragordonae]|uniref:Class I SAM-dependent methyltransferase n=1 Tax=Mycobacterium paragordonae TaxID=1389713 RepID=A0AAJ1W6Q2_9MYCO|nr:class I SAM-dependent methyltransferase [Mycobacterium paragordonae]MDP7739443.1 class I SAM-dependent methyltransferase [Mycobacterium paragordonae]PJE20328.1 MAG: methyltransferase [Mycobacterium sp.]
MQPGTESAPRRDRRSDGISPRAYEIFSGAWHFGQRARIWDHLVAVSGARPSQKVLAIGCGTGYFARRIAPVVGPSGLVVGIDPSPPSLDYAAAHAPPNCTFYPARAQNLPFADASFDVVVSSLTFHHIAPEHRVAGIQEALRVLRPGGWACIADVCPPRTRLLERVVSAAHGRAEMHDLFNRLRAMMAETGFSTVATGRVVATVLHHGRTPP